MVCRDQTKRVQGFHIGICYLSVAFSYLEQDFFRLKCGENNACRRPLVAYFLHKMNRLTVSEPLR